MNRPVAWIPDPRLVRAKERLDRLDWWPRAVRLEGIRILHAPWLFRLPPWRGYDGFATHRVIFLRHSGVSDDLVTHELCHVWQMQHRPVGMPLHYLRTGYDRSPYERQARAAARLTRASEGT
jgi:hypothetical protein